MEKTIEHIYQERIEDCKDQHDILDKSNKRYYTIRLISFLLIVAIIIFAFKYNGIAGIVAIYIGIMTFYRLVKHHNSIIRKKEIYNAKLKLNQSELKVVDNNFTSFQSGENYLNEQHPYVNDLDIFGTQSLFQSCNRCHSLFGKNYLAKLFSKGIDFALIPEMQSSISELEHDINLRQELFALMKNDQFEDKHTTLLGQWLKSQYSIRYYKWVMILLPIFSITAFILLINVVHWMLALVAFLPAAIFNYRKKERIDSIHFGISKSVPELKVYSESIQYLEEQSFESILLQKLQKRFLIKDKKASKAIKEFRYIVSQLDIRYNFFGIFFNTLFLWDYYWSWRADQWKSKNKDYATQWFETLGEFEAISSLATLAFNNPDWCFPKIQSEQKMTAIALGHPLIDRQQRVTNDFSSKTKDYIHIVTGSNMGGKSTFLRTVGINAVLANCGSKVCAASLDIPYLKVYTSMRTLDALEENTSSFYAELKRLKLVLDAVNSNENIFFLLDEILKGTNTKDRHNGAKALILQLLRNNGAGLISTHDLELGILAEQHPTQIENICFEVDVSEKELVFDYKLKKGISKSFNATHLMRNMGIDI